MYVARPTASGRPSARRWPPRHAQPHPALAGVLDLDAEVAPEEVGPGALADDGEQVGRHGTVV
jgi:hypothetical protein